jgi:hypothetical protein
MTHEWPRAKRLYVIERRSTTGQWWPLRYWEQNSVATTRAEARTMVHNLRSFYRSLRVVCYVPRSLR